MRKVLVLFLLASAAVAAELPAAPSEETIELYFFGRHHCGFSQRVVRSGVLPGLVESIRDEAIRRGASFESICIGSDTDPEAARVFEETACGSFDRIVNTGEGLETEEIQKFTHDPPSEDSMEFPPGDFGTPFVLILRTADGQITADRWISFTIITLASRLRELKKGTPLPDSMMPPASEGS